VASSASLGSAHYAERTLPTDVPRVYAKTRNVWVRPEPNTSKPWIGLLWFGGSVELKDPRPIPGKGCGGPWYAIEPRGYVCVDDKRATLNADDTILRALIPFTPDTTLPEPHPHYGESLGTVRYAELPDKQTMLRRELPLASEPDLLRAFLRETVRPSSSSGDAWPASLPVNLQEEHDSLVKGSAIAWTREVEHLGRSFLQTDDLEWIAKDRVVPLPPIDFEGVHLGQEARMPLAFFKRAGVPSFVRDQGGNFRPAARQYARHSWVNLTSVHAIDQGTELLETINGDWVLAHDAVVPEPRSETPWGAAVFGTDETGNAPAGRATWIQVSIRGGWLIAYEGTKPVFTTLVSPGRGGPPHGSRPLGSTASTPVGWFKITGKFATATMIAPDHMVHSAVPWAQNFIGPYSLHAAYWHDGWGYPKSSGCINLSPKDSFFLFGFTEPELPKGWHGVRWQPELGPATAVIVDAGPWRPAENEE
jgi:hypothetical protein